MENGRREFSEAEINSLIQHLRSKVVELELENIDLKAILAARESESSASE